MFFNISYIILLILGLLIPNSNLDHGIYISVIEFKHNEVDAKGEITIKSFSDDLLNALKGMDSNISLNNDPCDLTASFKDYIELHLKVDINEIPMKLKITNCEVENDTHWIYLEYAFAEKLSRVEIETDWFLDLFGNQQNIVKVTSNEIRQNARLSKDLKLATFNF